VECSSGGKVAPASSRDAIGGGATSTLFDCDAPGVDRFHFEGAISDADLNDYYLRVFRRPLTHARPAAIMCSFASVNGVPSCEWHDFFFLFSISLFLSRRVSCQPYLRTARCPRLPVIMTHTRHIHAYIGANGLMQNTLARETWGFDGFICTISAS
jgi:hypothetical protein